jgi:hypothetical protein
MNTVNIVGPKPALLQRAIVKDAYDHTQCLIHHDFQRAYCTPGNTLRTIDEYVSALLWVLADDLSTLPREQLAVRADALERMMAGALADNGSVRFIVGLMRQRRREVRKDVDPSLRAVVGERCAPSCVALSRRFNLQRATDFVTRSMAEARAGWSLMVDNRAVVTIDAEGLDFVDASLPSAKMDSCQAVRAVVDRMPSVRRCSLAWRTPSTDGESSTTIVHSCTDIMSDLITALEDAQDPMTPDQQLTAARHLCLLYPSLGDSSLQHQAAWMAECLVAAAAATKGSNLVRGRTCS